MNFIRLYNKKDYEIIKKWWIQADEPPPSIEMLPEDSTFVVVKDGQIVACVNAYLTNSKEVSFVENLVKDPNSNVNKKDIENLIEYTFNYIKKQGYKKAICFSYKESLKNRYLDFGFKKTLDNLTSFVKEL